MAQADPTLHHHEWRASQNMPPLSRMDMLGIAVAALGSAALIMIAVISAGGEHGHYSGVTIARTLIATGALLINMAHVVGILFFESVDYHGTYQRFLARVAIFGTTGAVVVSLAVGLL
ncbi:MAG TPA: hypothetical protein VHR38_05890 [Solirubrobacterales bacterium]|jgi:hypothetical protein|nr:hypothetical protein [Solirubrobacterales bacterium]